MALFSTKKLLNQVILVENYVDNVKISFRTADFLLFRILILSLKRG